MGLSSLSLVLVCCLITFTSLFESHFCLVVIADKMSGAAMSELV